VAEAAGAGRHEVAESEYIAGRAGAGIQAGRQTAGAGRGETCR